MLRANWPLLLLFIVVVIGVGMLVGVVSSPGSWYERLVKPEAMIVPEWFSGSVWLLLCFAFAIAGWRLWLRDSSSLETKLWLAILILSWWFAPTFFVAKAPWVAFGIMLVLWVLMVLFIGRTWSRERVSAWLFVPCALWVAYAAVVTGWIASLN